MARCIIHPKENGDIYRRFGYAPAVSAGGFLFISGQVGILPDGSAPTDPEEEIRQAFTNMGHVLSAASASLDDVVDLTVFYTNYPEHMALGRAVRDEVFGTATPPNWTSVGVAALSPPFIFEAKAIALLP